MMRRKINLARKVCVLISTYNGEDYLEDQINSIINQTYQYIDIMVRDDGSTDGTIKILESYKEKGLLEYTIGENIGVVKSFSELLRNASKYDFYAFCDQDDVWANNKIETAVKKLNNLELKKPNLYFSKSVPVDDKMNILHHKNNNYFKYADELSLSIVRNLCQGCTSVFNYTLAEAYNKFEGIDFSMHDWWIYLLCLSLNGNIIADNNYYVYYRQHENNVVGANPSIINRLKRRLSLIISKRENTRMLMSKIILENMGPGLDSNTYSILKKVSDYQKSPRAFFALLFDRRFYSNSIEYNLSFVISVLTFVF